MFGSDKIHMLIFIHFFMATKYLRPYYAIGLLLMLMSPYIKIV